MSQYPYGISEILTQDDRQRLEATAVSLGHGRSMSVADLVVGWAAHVTKLSDERNLKPGEDRDAWNGHDYIAALIIRGFVERGLDLIDGECRARATQVVDRIDRVLTSYTEPDTQGFVRRFAIDDAGPQWWWDRLPQSGPVREELLAAA